ncbi:hypothetical protein HK102_014218 [Quaeritorhiza haematococci]|nr:hypothetical protein HK102_014218 [Quaeritorhiza haematococci]
MSRGNGSYILFTHFRTSCTAGPTRVIAVPSGNCLSLGPGGGDPGWALPVPGDLMANSQFATGECGPNGLVRARLCTGGCNSTTCGAVTSECSGSFAAFFAATCQTGSEVALPIASNSTSSPGSNQGSPSGNSSVSENNAGSNSSTTPIFVVVAMIAAILVFGVFVYRRCSRRCRTRRKPAKMASTTTTAGFYSSSSPPPSTSTMTVGELAHNPAVYPHSPAAYAPTSEYTTAYQQSYAPAAYPSAPAAYITIAPQHPPPPYENTEVSISNYQSAPTTESSTSRSTPTTTESHNVDFSAVKSGEALDSDVRKEDGVVQML